MYIKRESKRERERERDKYNPNLKMRLRETFKIKRTEKVNHKRDTEMKKEQGKYKKRQHRHTNVRNEPEMYEKNECLAERCFSTQAN